MLPNEGLVVAQSYAYSKEIKKNMGKRKNLNRDRIEIFGNILEVSTEGVRKTHLMRRCSLSFKQVVPFLEELQKKGLIRQYTDDEGNAVYMTTENGRKFLNSFRIMMDAINGTGEGVIAEYIIQNRQAISAREMDNHHRLQLSSHIQPAQYS